MSPIPAVYVMGILSLQSSLLDVVTYFRHKNVLLKHYTCLKLNKYPLCYEPLVSFSSFFSSLVIMFTTPTSITSCMPGFENSHNM